MREYKSGIFKTWGIHVLVEDNFTYWYAESDYAYYKLRGVPVTKEEAFEIIRQTDKFFLYTVYENIEECKFKQLCTFENNFMDKYNGGMYHGWIRPNGIIGGNSVTEKYVEFDNIIGELLLLKSEFTYLDMVVAISIWEQVAPEYWDSYDDESLSSEEFNKRWLLEEYNQGFEDAIDILFWVHEDKIEVYQGEKAKQKYLEYESLYNTDNSEQFAKGYYEYYNVLPLNKEYIKRIADSYNISIKQLKSKLEILLDKAMLEELGD